MEEENLPKKCKFRRISRTCTVCKMETNNLSQHASRVHSEWTDAEKSAWRIEMLERYPVIKKTNAKSRQPLKRCKLCSKCVRRLDSHLSGVHGVPRNSSKMKRLLKVEKLAPRQRDPPKKLEQQKDRGLPKKQIFRRITRTCTVCKMETNNLSQHATRKHREWTDGEKTAWRIEMLERYPITWKSNPKSRQPLRRCKLCGKSVRRLDNHLSCTHGIPRKSSKMKELLNVDKPAQNRPDARKRRLKKNDGDLPKEHKPGRISRTCTVCKMETNNLSQHASREHGEWTKADKYAWRVEMLERYPITWKSNPKSRQPLRRCKLCGKSVRRLDNHLSRTHGIPRKSSKMKELLNVKKPAPRRPASTKKLEQQKDGDLPKKPKFRRISRTCTVCKKETNNLSQHASRNHTDWTDAEKSAWRIEMLERYPITWTSNPKSRQPLKQCKLCGKSLKRLDNHLSRTHGIPRNSSKMKELLNVEKSVPRQPDSTSRPMANKDDQPKKPKSPIQPDTAKGLLSKSNGDLPKKQTVFVLAPRQPDLMKRLPGSKDGDRPEMHSSPRLLDTTKSLLSKNDGDLPKKQTIFVLGPRQPDSTKRLLGNKDGDLPEMRSSPDSTKCLLAEKDGELPENHESPDSTKCLLAEKDGELPENHESRKQPDSTASLLAEQEGDPPEKHTSPEQGDSTVSPLAEQEGDLPKKKTFRRISRTCTVCKMETNNLSQHATRQHSEWTDAEKYAWRIEMLERYPTIRTTNPKSRPPLRRCKLCRKSVTRLDNHLSGFHYIPRNSSRMKELLHAGKTATRIVRKCTVCNEEINRLSQHACRKHSDWSDEKKSAWRAEMLERYPIISTTNPKSRPPLRRCKLCSLSVRRLDNHLSGVHGIPRNSSKMKKLLNIDKPDKALDSGQDYRQPHSATCTGESSHHSEKLTDSEPLNGHLEIHRNTHAGEEPYKCYYCDEGFALEGNLCAHLRTCTGVPHHSHQEFPQENALNRHLRTDTGEKSFQSSFCDYALAPSRDVTPVTTHSRERPHKCSNCDKALFCFES